MSYRICVQMTSTVSTVASLVRNQRQGFKTRDPLRAFHCAQDASFNPASSECHRRSGDSCACASQSPVSRDSSMYRFFRRQCSVALWRRQICASVSVLAAPQQHQARCQPAGHLLYHKHCTCQVRPIYEVNKTMRVSVSAAVVSGASASPCGGVRRPNRAGAHPGGRCSHQRHISGRM